jgi:preprotein translocase subunit SecE
MARSADAGRGPIAARPQREPQRPAGEVPEHRRRFSFIHESWAELKKVEWPSQKQVIQGTVVVLIACLVVGFYLWGADQVFKRLVQEVLLR